MKHSLFQIIDNKVEEIPVESLYWSEGDLTTTPIGIGPKYHIEGSHVYKWNCLGRRDIIVKFDTETEAQEHLNELLVSSALEDQNILYFATKEQAQKFLEDNHN